MRSHCVAILVGTLLGATTALGATEMEVFQKKVQKYAAPTGDVFDKPRGLCACINDPGNADNNGMAGVLDSAIVQTGDNPPGRVRVRCMVMKATVAGNIQVAESCENFVPLSK